MERMERLAIISNAAFISWWRIQCSVFWPTHWNATQFIEHIDRFGFDHW